MKKDLLLFFIWPLLSFIESVKRGFRNRADKIILLLFSGFIGLNLSINSTSSDINRYRDRFFQYHDRDYDYLLQYLSEYLTFKADNYDILNVIINFTLSRFTDNVYILYLTFGLIFGYFYSSVITRIGEFHIKLKLLDFLMIISLLVVVFPTKGINEFRFYTASFIFLHGIITYVLDKNKNGLIFIALALLTHISIFLPACGFCLYLLLPKLNIKLVLFLLLISLLGGYSLSFLEPLISSIGGAVENKYIDYSGEIAAERMEGFRNRVWYAAYYREILISGLVLPIFHIYRNRNYLDKRDYSLLRLALFLMITTSLTINIYMYQRYFDLLAVFLIFFITYYSFKYRQPVFKKYLIYISPVLILMIAINVSDVIRFLTPYLLIDNIFTVWIFQGIFN